jgi:F-type H+-transporting ATPase subunit alpha
MKTPADDLTPVQGLRPGLHGSLDALHQSLETRSVMLHPRDTGTVLRVGQGIAMVRGLPSLKSEELVEFADGTLGIAVDLRPEATGVILLGGDERLLAAGKVRATGRIADAPVGERLLGRVLDATGKTLDEGEPLHEAKRWPIEHPAPSIIDRAPVSVPLATGHKAIDALLPIGRGQRELIIGDRQTGKTSIAVDAMLNQRDSGVVCIYCAIGQRATAVARVIQTLRSNHAMANSIVVVATGDDPPGLQYITPYAATTMAEWFMQRGQDVLLVYDDLTRHARAYRELSLLLRRPPGREAFPGDIFYVHSRLLERAAQLGPHRGGGSLTALPIVETQAQNLSAYIPTNLVSITDGQVLLSPELRNKGLLPAVDLGRSVSRVGSRAQPACLREIAPDLRIAHAQFEELESFSRFGTRLDEASRNAIERGRRVREVLRQNEHEPLTASEQAAVLLALNKGLFDRLELTQIAAAERVIRQAFKHSLGELATQLESGAKFDEDSRASLLTVMREALERAFPQERDETGR